MKKITRRGQRLAEAPCWDDFILFSVIVGAAIVSNKSFSIKSSIYKGDKFIAYEDDEDNCTAKWLETIGRKLIDKYLPIAESILSEPLSYSPGQQYPVISPVLYDREAMKSKMKPLVARILSVLSDRSDKVETVNQALKV